LTGAIRDVGDAFAAGDYFLPELLGAAEAMQSAMPILNEEIKKGPGKIASAGKVVAGTVAGDIHNIGKSIFCTLLSAEGFEVVDLGINNPVENYLEALKTEDADILGMSALLTTTMPYMKVVIDTMIELGIRDDYIVLVGGAPLNEEFGKAIGADAYCRDAAVAVETAKEFMGRKHNQMAAG